MIRNPIQEVTNKLQYRAIGIVKGIYKPNDLDQLNRGTIIDKEGKIIDTVVLGKALSLLKKRINLEKDYFWIVYPRNKGTSDLHFQIAGIWDPYQFNKVDFINSQKDLNELLDELNLNNNYFSIRGELVYVNTKKREVVIKICSSPRTNNLKKMHILKLLLKERFLLNF